MSNDKADDATNEVFLMTDQAAQTGNGATAPVLDEAHLLAQFSDLLAAVAGEVGQLSVKPAADRIIDRVDRHEVTLGETLLAHQAAVELTVERADKRELQAAGILEAVRALLVDGLDANRDAFSAAVSRLWDDLRAFSGDTERNLQDLAAASAVLTEQVLPRVQEVQHRLDEAGQLVASSAERVESVLTQHQQELNRQAALLVTRLVEKCQALEKAATDAVRASGERDRETKAAVTGLEQRLDGLAKQALAQKESMDAVHTSLRSLEVMVRSIASALAATRTTVDEVHGVVTAPRGLAKLFGG